ncbi:MAG: alanine/ornithine racemase family PLP-dependent enzyme [Spirochaetes bacterium]|nr:alanine/ornithine racemase family PLP-dependent enzyme [Spirochaetota bacterium]MBU1080429.1 alanine/ornithine racemase family PLP-dependent enzyme [Spirochaetota bacterium]
MRFRTPRLEIYPARIAANARSLMSYCSDAGVQVAFVTKVVCAHRSVARALYSAGPDMLADSRIANLRSIGEAGIALPRLLLRLPSRSEIEDVVRDAEISLNSSLATLKSLSEAALARKVKHQVIVMVDVGDLREGVWPDEAPALVMAAAGLKGIEIIGMGCNLACYGGVVPSEANMRTLVEVRDLCRRKSGLELGLLSGGNSANLPLLASGRMPKEINHLRLGESVLLGRNVLDRSPWPGTRQDAFRIVAEVIETVRKPSVPIGERGQDAFGGYQEFEDRGIRKRAICAIGRQDAVVDGLEPESKGIRVLGGSSDHLLLDVEDAPWDVEVGDEIAFAPGYGALLAASTSPYVTKAVIED